MTVERLIKQLENYNPMAEVRLNDCRGTVALFALAVAGNDSLVWIEGKNDIDLGEEIRARFSKAYETQMNEFEFFVNLLEMGITLEDIKEHCPDKYEYSKTFMKEHGLVRVTNGTEESMKRFKKRCVGLPERKRRIKN